MVIKKIGFLRCHDCVEAIAASLCPDKRKRVLDKNHREAPTSGENVNHLISFLSFLLRKQTTALFPVEYLYNLDRNPYIAGLYEIKGIV